LIGRGLEDDPDVGTGHRPGQGDPPACERRTYGRANARESVEVPCSSRIVMISHPEAVAVLVVDVGKESG
jgi:hypothetical protein